MPILLKNKTLDSPGIISFNHNEVLFGVPAKFNKVNNFLLNLSKKKEWIFGVHIQGDLSWFGKWKPLEWQDFFMWPNKNDTILENIPEKKKTELTCINFHNKILFKKRKKNIKYDLCSITRFSSIKKIDVTIKIFKKLLESSPKLRLLLVASYQSKFRFFSKEKNYVKKSLLLIKEQFSSEQLKQIDFICSPSEIFGSFPVKEEMLYELVSSCKSLLLNSHQEGMPRSIVEALCLKTKVIISSNLKFAIKKYLNSQNSLIYKENNQLSHENNINFISKQILNFLKYKNDISNNNWPEAKIFNEKTNIPILKKFFLKIFKEKKIKFSFNQKNWHLNNLNKRLACHGYADNLIFMNNDESFFSWFEKIKDNKKNTLEKFLYQESLSLDKKIKYRNELIHFIKYNLLRISNKFLQP